MLYMEIDQRGKQLTIDLGDEEGNLVMHRQVSTEWASLKKFLSELRELAEAHGGYVALVEVCGFNGYLLDALKDYAARRPLSYSRRNGTRERRTVGMLVVCENCCG